MRSHKDFLEESMEEAGESLTVGLTEQKSHSRRRRRRKATEPVPTVDTVDTQAAGNTAANNSINSTGNITSNATSNATGNATSNATGNATDNATMNATGNITTNDTGNSTNSTGDVPLDVIPPGPFVLQNTPYTRIRHQVASISPQQWPHNFCVNMNFTGPQIDTTEHQRCIAMFGGHESCGSFYMFLDDDNEPGMGVRCAKGGPLGDLPLSGGNSSHESAVATNTTYFLQFCYNADTKEAGIWKDHERVAHGKKRWNFQRKGYVSIFVGTHVEMDFAEAFEQEDQAKLLNLSFSDYNSTETTTAAPSTTTTAAPTPNPIQEVDLNETDVTDEEKPFQPLWPTPTPEPWWNETHHRHILNVTNSLTNKTYVIRDEITTVTEKTIHTITKHTDTIRTPGTDAFGHNITIELNSTSVATDPEGVVSMNASATTKRTVVPAETSTAATGKAASVPAANTLPTSAPL
jgi:hypothetical protein